MSPMNRSILLVFLLSCGAAFAQLKQAPQPGTALDKPVLVPRGDPAMEAAFKKARESLDGFLEIAKAPSTSVKAASVKVRISEGNKVEYFWVTPFHPEGNGFGGFLQNEPSTIHKYKLGDPVRFTKADIVDWMYMDGMRKKVVGNYSGCALLAKRPPAERQKARLEYGLECES
jgi:uncharacterized protein YegJ (DUF2314 family)